MEQFDTDLRLANETPGHQSIPFARRARVLEYWLGRQE
jgi:hypothetical protein